MSTTKLLDANGPIKDYLKLIRDGKIRTAELFVVEMRAATRSTRFAVNPTKDLLIFCCQELIDTFNQTKNKKDFWYQFFLVVKEDAFTGIKNRLVAHSDDGTLEIPDYGDIHRLVIIASGKDFPDRINWMETFLKTVKLNQDEAKIANFVYEALKDRYRDLHAGKSRITTAAYSSLHEEAYYQSCIDSNKLEDIVVQIHEKRMYPLKNAKEDSTRLNTSEKFFEKFVVKDNKKKK